MVLFLTDNTLYNVGWWGVSESSGSFIFDLSDDMTITDAVMEFGNPQNTSEIIAYDGKNYFRYTGYANLTGISNDGYGGKLRIILNPVGESSFEAIPGPYEPINESNGEVEENE